MLSRPARPIHFGPLREQLGVSARKLRQLMRAGLPHTMSVTGAPLFDGHAVATWLVQTGRAARTSPAASIVDTSRVARTIGETAVHFGVAVRTVGFWLREPGFPGRAGSPGRRDGHFPLEAIAAWLSTRGTDHNEEIAHLRLRRLTARTRREELQLAKQRANLAPRDTLVSVARELSDLASQQLDHLVDGLMRDAPALPPPARKKLRGLFQRRLAEARHMLAECVAADDESD